MSTEPDPPAVIAARAAWLLQAAADAFDALQAPDPVLDAERAVIWGKPATPAPLRRAA